MPFSAEVTRSDPRITVRRGHPDNLYLSLDVPDAVELRDALTAAINEAQRSHVPEIVPWFKAGDRVWINGPDLASTANPHTEGVVAGIRPSRRGFDYRVQSGSGRRGWTSWYPASSLERW